MCAIESFKEEMLRCGKRLQSTPTVYVNLTESNGAKHDLCKGRRTHAAACWEVLKKYIVQWQNKIQ